MTDSPAGAEHLRMTTSERGFDAMPPIPSEYGGEVRVYESSAASGPHIWLKAEAPVDLNDPDGFIHEVPIHLTAENAWRLAEQLMALVRDHYQGDEAGVALEALDEEANALHRVRALADRAAGYGFILAPEQIYEALDGDGAPQADVPDVRDAFCAWLASLYPAAQYGCCGIFEGEGSAPCPDCLTDEILSASSVKVEREQVVIRLPVQSDGEVP